MLCETNYSLFPISFDESFDNFCKYSVVNLTPAKSIKRDDKYVLINTQRRLRA